MTLHSRRDFVCFQRDVRGGSWYRVRLQVGRNKIHVAGDNLLLDQSTEAQQDKKRFDSSVSFKLNDFKLEVGQFTSSVPAYYCLYLKSGHSRVTFGFETIEVLEVRRVLLVIIIRQLVTAECHQDTQHVQESLRPEGTAQSRVVSESPWSILDVAGRDVMCSGASQHRKTSQRMERGRIMEGRADQRKWREVRVRGHQTCSHITPLINNNNNGLF